MIIMRIWMQIKKLVKMSAFELLKAASQQVTPELRDDDEKKTGSEHDQSKSQKYTNLMGSACRKADIEEFSQQPNELIVHAKDGHKIHLWHKSSTTVEKPPVWVLLHGRTWSSIPVTKFNLVVSIALF